MDSYDFIYLKDQESSPVLKTALKTLKKKKISINCVDRKNFKTVFKKKLMQKGKPVIYVLKSYEDTLYDELMLKGDVRVIGPNYILHYYMKLKKLKKNEINIISENILKNYSFSLKFHSFRMCCSGFEPKQRDFLHDIILKLGGKVSRHLTKFCTHLISNTLVSDKARKAQSFNIPIINKDWILETWKLEQNESKIEDVNVLLYTDSFKLQPLSGARICTSGLLTTQIEEFKNIIVSLGGKMTDCDLECTHLVAKSRAGKKIQFAIENNIKVVNTQWLYDCKEEKRLLEEEKYKAELILPEESQCLPQVMSQNPNLDIESQSFGLGGPLKRRSSFIDGPSKKVKSLIQRNELELVTEEMFNKLAAAETNFFTETRSESEYSHFAGCIVYFSGFKSRQRLDVLRKAVLAGGGTRYPNLSECVTHVVIGGANEKDMKKIHTMENHPSTVTSKWVVDCCIEKAILPVTTYQLQIKQHLSNLVWLMNPVVASFELATNTSNNSPPNNNNENEFPIRPPYKKKTSLLGNTSNAMQVLVANKNSNSTNERGRQPTTSLFEKVISGKAKK